MLPSIEPAVLGHHLGGGTIMDRVASMIPPPMASAGLTESVDADDDWDKSTSIP